MPPPAITGLAADKARDSDADSSPVSGLPQFTHWPLKAHERLYRWKHKGWVKEGDYYIYWSHLVWMHPNLEFTITVLVGLKVFFTIIRSMKREWKVTCCANNMERKMFNLIQKTSYSNTCEMFDRFHECKHCNNNESDDITPYPRLLLRA